MSKADDIRDLGRKIIKTSRSSQSWDLIADHIYSLDKTLNVIADFFDVDEEADSLNKELINSNLENEKLRAELSKLSGGNVGADQDKA